MNRCIRIFIAGSALLASIVSAQGIQRDAPKDVVLGQLVVTAPPQVTMDGKPDRLSPGSRIRDLNNMLVLSGGVVGKTLPVVYRRDAAGLVHEAWVLTDEEYRKLGGVSGTSSPEGHKRFADLLAVIFGARR
jgi:hypothetical protein